MLAIALRGALCARPSSPDGVVLLTPVLHAVQSGQTLAVGMAENLSWDLTEIKKDVFVANRECSQRGLLQSAKWYIHCCF